MNRISLLSLILLGVATPLLLQAEPIGTAKRVQGNVVVFREGQSSALQNGAVIHNGDTVKTSANGRAQLVMKNLKTLFISADSEMVLKSEPMPEQPKQDILDVNIVSGALRAAVGGPKGEQVKMRVRTKTAVAGVRGTTFGFSVTNNGEASVYSLGGDVRLGTTDGQERHVPEGSYALMNQRGTASLDKIFPDQVPALIHSSLKGEPVTETRVRTEPLGAEKYAKPVVPIMTPFGVPLPQKGYELRFDAQQRPRYIVSPENSISPQPDGGFLPVVEDKSVVDAKVFQLMAQPQFQKNLIEGARLSADAERVKNELLTLEISGTASPESVEAKRAAFKDVERKALNVKEAILREETRVLQQAAQDPQLPTLQRDIAQAKADLRETQLQAISYNKGDRNTEDTVGLQNKLSAQQTRLDSLKVESLQATAGEVMKQYANLQPSETPTKMVVHNPGTGAVMVLDNLAPTTAGPPTAGMTQNLAGLVRESASLADTFREAYATDASLQNTGRHLATPPPPLPTVTQEQMQQFCQTNAGSPACQQSASDMLPPPPPPMGPPPGMCATNPTLPGCGGGTAGGTCNPGDSGCQPAGFPPPGCQGVHCQPGSGAGCALDPSLPGCQGASTCAANPCLPQCGGNCGGNYTVTVPVNVNVSCQPNGTSCP